MDSTALFKISYGLFVLTANENGFDNGCIINTFSQATGNPCRVTVTVNKLNKTHDMIMNTNKFNVSIISTNAPFSLFEHFGFHSGKDTNKFDNYPNSERGKNGIYYIPGFTNSYFECTVAETVDLGTHTMFIADVDDAAVLSDFESMTYDFYHKNVKPKPQKTEKKGYRCKICGYVYEGDELPEDFICPLCKHPAEDFEKI